MASIDAEQFSLRWNNFHNNLTAGFHDLLLGEDLVDVTLAAEGKFVQAHKMVLSVCSPYFKDLFKVNPCKHPIVILKDTGYKELEALLQFMYRGEVNVRQEELAMFLKTAEMLQIKGLTGSESKKESAEPTINKNSSNLAPSRTHSLPQDSSTHPPPKRKRSEAPALPSTSTPNTPSQIVDVPPQSPSENLGNDQAIQDQNDFMQMMNPKMEPQDYDESQDGLDMMADDSVGQDPLVQQLLGGGDGKGNMPAMGNYVGLPGMKDGNIGPDGGQESWKVVVNCNLCGKVLKRGSLRKHMVDRHSDNVQASNCQYCHKPFRTANSLSNHLSLYHRELVQAARKMRQPGQQGQPTSGGNLTALVASSGPVHGPAPGGAAAVVAGAAAAAAASVGVGGCGSGGPLGPAAVPVIMQVQQPQFVPISMASLEVTSPVTICGPSPLPAPSPTPSPAPVRSGSPSQSAATQSWNNCSF